ncbi:universal stress protein [Variovorax sp. JS1663]|uniref:universal stress protein n=1 Tax=Variovorax sp. JS1663 TaxID=1851577 RepID=UPI000B341310|nr:universal stress protein [Variovorax sp. JS1663]OUM00909.1 hypothetical protein A8M77_18555 [Variovorax sp. JS1663]
MNDFRSILVHLDGSVHAQSRLHVAHRIAAHHHAMLTVMFAVTPQYLPLHLLQGHSFSSRMPRKVDAGHRSRALALFEQARSAGGCTVTWQELDGEPVVERLARRALASDLLVLGQRDPLDASGFDVPGDLTEATIIASGRPSLVVPFAGTAAPIPQVALVAWKSTPECARALAASLPFLRKATQVHLVCASDALDESDPAPVHLPAYLRLHGIDQVHEHRPLADHEAGHAILSLAAQTRADLIVMGCYGHSRARELVLGGASRRILESAQVPVLMSH